MDDRHDHDGCPVVDIDYTLDRPAFWHYDSLGRVREDHAVAWNPTGRGYWMITRYDEAKEALKMPAVFSNAKVNAFDPDMDLPLLPQTLGGAEHTALRALLNPWFSPGAVRRLEPHARARCAAMIDELVPLGHCDLVSDFAIRYPTDVFLHTLGLPLADGPTFVGWVEAIFGGLHGHETSSAADAATEVRAYFDEVMADRAAHPRDPATDFVSYLRTATLGDQPVDHETAVTICATIMLAGLDTTRSAIGYGWHHLATHDEDRRHLVADPATMPRALEELLRLYSLLIQDGRLVESDVEFHGCPMRQGEMISVGIISANRDPRKFDRPDEFVADRAPNPHIAFGLGPHRCLGMHLARLELTLALEEWHARIPDYRLADGAVLDERGGQISLASLPLRWDPSPA